MTPGQVRLLRSARFQLGLSATEFASLLWSNGQCFTPSELSQDGFRAVLRELQRRGFRWTPRAEVRRRRDGESGLIVPEQVEAIRRAWPIAARDPSEEGLARWLRGSHGVARLDDASFAEGERIIRALRSRTARRAFLEPAGSSYA